MIAKIAPLIRLGQSVDCFDYFIPEEFEKIIKPGQMAEIPWRSKKIKGIIIGFARVDSKKNFRPRPISKILSPLPVLSRYQIELAKKFSEYYFVTLRQAIRLMAPDYPLKNRSDAKKIIAHSDFKIDKSKITALTDSAKKALEKKYIRISDVSSFVWLILYIYNITKNQVFVLLPTIDLVESVYCAVQKKCSNKTAIIHSGLGIKKFWEEYKKILTKSAKIILSTRQGVFLPISPKSSIIFFEYTSQDFKQYDQSPRYDARIVAQWIAGENKSKIFFTSASGSIWKNESETSDLSPAFELKTKIIFSDMKKEMTKKDFSIISEKSLEYIKKTIKENKKTIIISLRESSEKGVSVNKIYNILTEKLKNCKIAKNHPQKSDFDILVATPYALEGLKLLSERGKIGLAIFISIEPLISIPDFRSGERVFNKLNFWKILCRELRIPAIILQAYSPENLSIRAFCYGEYEQWVKSEKENRKHFFWPPYSTLIKLWPKKGQSPDTEETIKEIKKCFKNKSKISGPFKDSKGKNSILIKLNKTTNGQSIKKFAPQWAIDRNPENIL